MEGRLHRALDPPQVPVRRLTTTPGTEIPTDVAPKLSIVIPARNEQDSLRSTVEAIERTPLPRHEIVVVDDHSTDATWRVAEELCTRHPSVRPIRNPGPGGFANAILAGIAAARGEAVVPMMADLCDDPGTVRAMWAMIEQGADVVCGSRYAPGGRKVGGPLLKSVLSRALGHLMRWTTRIPTWDSTNAFKMYRRAWAPRQARLSSGFSVSLEWVLAAWFAGARIGEVPTTWSDRTAGVSHFRTGPAIRSYGRVVLAALWRVLAGRGHHDPLRGNGE